MILHVLGWLYAFVFAAVLSVGITLAPMAVAWSSFWVYATFALCLIPGYIAAWLTVMAAVLIIPLIGFLFAFLALMIAGGISSFFVWVRR